MAEQSKYWADFYEEAWGARRHIFEKLHEEGVNDPFSLIKKYERYSLHYTLRMIDGKVYEVPLETGKGTVFPTTGVPVGKKLGFNDTGYVCSFYESNIQLLVDHICLDSFDAIIELGAGYAGNLIEIWYAGGPQNIPYYAGEFTSSGLDCIKYLSNLRPEMQLIPFYFDHKSPDFKGVTGRKVFIFTCHSIEQIRTLPDDYFQKIANSFESVTCLHLEPFGFQLEPNSDEISQEQMALFIKNQWNLNFAQLYLDSMKRGEIISVLTGKNIAPGVNQSNPTSIAIWKNK